MVHAPDELERGRGSYGACAWLAAYESLSRADQVDPLAAEDLELLARSAYMLGRDDEYVVAASASCIAPRSCSCGAPGETPWTRRGRPPRASQKELHLVEGAGHMPWFHDPKGVAAAVTRFLAE